MRAEPEQLVTPEGALESLWSRVAPWLADDAGVRIGWSVTLAVLGLGAAWLASRSVGRLARGRVEVQVAQMIRRFVFGLVAGIFLLVILQQWGVELGVLFGAAGVLTVAIGFASQTSASNLISGIFLVAERSFAVGDTIRVGQITGEVLSIDLLSVKLRQFDNVYVRMPNEQLIKERVETLTRYPIRRVDVPIPISYRVDVATAKERILEVVRGHPEVLREPEPFFISLGFGEFAFNLRLSAWTRSESVFPVGLALHEAILRDFREAGIEWPVPRRHLEGDGREEPAAAPEEEDFE